MAPKRVFNKRRGKKVTKSIGQQIQDYNRKHAEHKFFESVVSQTIDTSWNIFAITQNIVQGITGGQRIGDNIELVFLRIVGRITVNTTASFANVRFVLVLDKMNDSIAPVYGDLFLDNGVDSTYSPEQIKAKRFTILMDTSFPLNTQGIGAHMINRVMKLNQKVSYNATTSITAANGKNSMWLFVVNDNGANKRSINMNFQVEFIDP